MFDSQVFLKTLTLAPGVYQMLGAAGEVLYVGKARQLKKRLASYFSGKQSLKTAALVNSIANIEIIVTHTETEALLLECNLIKQFQPRYNVLLRDDKGYPYIVLTEKNEFPRLDFYRGARRVGNRYFGPYPSSTSVRETLNLLQKIFTLRSCQDDFFKNRTRPCLQHQIKRCSAPCVGLIDPVAYQQDVQRAVLFLEGKSQAVIEELVQRMEHAASHLDFEKAAHFRDQIANLRRVQQQQAITTDNNRNVDAIALAQRDGVSCLQVMMIRNGRLLGGKAYFPSVPELSTAEEIISAFIAQYYLAAESLHEIPQQILVSHKFDDSIWIASALTQRAERQVTFTFQPRGESARWLQIAARNAQESLASHLSNRSSVAQRFAALQEFLGLENAPQRLECFDISHIQGEATVASCVVFDENGARKSDYRRFNIEGITQSDDYAALYQALLRRYTKVKASEGVLPDVVIIDGGKGQLKQAEMVLEELQVSGVMLMSIAKGPTRKPGLETLYISGRSEPVVLASDSLALHLLQQIRDEAHRFAIMGHRARRQKRRQTSILEDIPGVGAKRRRELLRQFGGLQELTRASIAEIAKLPGIDKALAERIYNSLHGL